MSRFVYFVALLVTACANNGPVPMNPDVLRARADMERRIAVGNPGTLVCREMRIGIGTVDWLRGSVVRIEGDWLVVKILDPGRFSHSIEGAAVEQGASVRDSLNAWAPCN